MDTVNFVVSCYLKHSFSRISVYRNKNHSSEIVLNLKVNIITIKQIWTLQDTRRTLQIKGSVLLRNIKIFIFTIRVKRYYYYYYYYLNFRGSTKTRGHYGHPNTSILYREFYFLLFSYFNK